MWINYFNGKQAILSKKPVDLGRPNNIVCTNFTRTVVQNYAGFLTPQYGDLDERVLDVLKYSDFQEKDRQLYRDALIQGIAFEVVYTDEYGEQNFVSLPATEMIPVYSDTMDGTLRAVIRIYSTNYSATQTAFKVEVYGEKSVKYYDSTAGYSSLAFREEKPYFYGQCPVVVFSLNPEKTSVFDPVMSLQDAFNTAMSDQLDSEQEFSAAMLVLKGVTAGDDENMAKMKTARCLEIEPDASIEYLVRDETGHDAQIQNILNVLRKNIFNITSCPDYQSEDWAGAASGVAQQYRMLNFIMASDEYASRWRVALQKRLELISSIVALKEGDEVWKTVDISFVKNIPQEQLDITKLLQMRSLVSDETLLEQIPFVQDVPEELARIKKQKDAQMNLYQFGDRNAAEDSTEDSEPLG